jgi:hypothetical protein
MDASEFFLEELSGQCQVQRQCFGTVCVMRMYRTNLAVSVTVIPAQAGVQCRILDSRLRGNDRPLRIPVVTVSNDVSQHSATGSEPMSFCVFSGFP